MRRLLCFLAFALLLLGTPACSHPLDTAILAANGTKAFLASAHDTLADLHRSMRDHAVELSDTEVAASIAARDVHTRFRPAWDAYDDARTAWILAAAAIDAAQALEAAGEDPDEPAIRDALLQVASAVDTFRTTVAAVTRPRGTQGAR